MPKERRKKVSYACAACRRLKVKCDHAIPCSLCVKNNRVEECLSDPAKMLSHFKELIRPNASFGRITKTKAKPGKSVSPGHGGGNGSNNNANNNGNNGNVHQTQILPSTDSIDETRQSLIIEDLQGQLSQKSIAFDQLVEQNLMLKTQNETLVKRIWQQIDMNMKKKGPQIQELYSFPLNEADKTQKQHQFKRSMLEILPPQNIVTILKAQYLTYLNEQAMINTSMFESQLHKFWKNLSQNNIYDIDLSWLALLFMMLSISLISSLNTSVLSSSPFFQHLIQLKTNGIEVSSLWFNTARQILEFIRDDEAELTRIQVFTIGTIYCRITNNFKLFDYFLSQAVHELHRLDLDEFDKMEEENSIEKELKVVLFWKIFNLDTIRSFNKKTKLPILGFNSTIPLPSDTFRNENVDPNLPSCVLFDGFKIKLIQVLNKFKFDSLLNNSQAKVNNNQFEEILNFDQVYNHEFISIPKFAKLEKHTPISASMLSLVLLFDINNLHLFYSITRFKMLQKFLGYRIPYVDTVCLSLVKNVFLPYKILKKSTALDGDPIFLFEDCKTFEESMIGGSIMQLMFLILVGDQATESIKTFILKDVEMILNDLTFLEQRQLIHTEMNIIVEGHRIISSLKTFINLNHSLYSLASFEDNTISERMNVQVLVNNTTISVPTGGSGSSTFDTVIDMDQIPQYAIEESIERHDEIVANNYPQVFDRLQKEAFDELVRTEGMDLKVEDIEGFILKGFT